MYAQILNDLNSEGLRLLFEIDKRISYEASRSQNIKVEVTGAICKVKDIK